MSRKALLFYAPVLVFNSGSIRLLLPRQKSKINLSLIDIEKSC